MHVNPITTAQITFAAILIASACPKTYAQDGAPTNPSATAHSAQQVHQVRMEYDRFRISCPIIHLSINGHKPLSFLMDIGANVGLIVMPWAAKILELKPSGEKLEFQNGKIPLMDLKSFECVLSKEEGNAKTLLYNGEFDTIVHDLSGTDEMIAGDRIAGMVGVDVWQGLTVSLDFQARSLGVTEGSHPPKTTPDMVTLALKDKGDYRFCVTVQDLQGQPVDFYLDTGDPLTELPQKDVARFGAHTTSSARGVNGISFGPHGEALAVLDTLHLGSATTAQVEVSVPPARVASIEATLGMNVLSRYRVTIDFPGKKVYLEPAADSEMQARLPGLHVIHVEKHGPQILVGIVDAGSAADRAGIREHDHLLAVDGAAVDELPISVVQDMVDGLSGTEAHLRIERSGQIHEIVYHRYSLADDIVTAHLGMATSVADDFSMFIDSVKKGSPAQKAGLHKEDIIISIGGYAVKTTDDERLQSILKNPQSNPIVLTVKRKGADHSEEVKLAW